MGMAAASIATIIGGAFSYLNNYVRDPTSDPGDRILVRYYIYSEHSPAILNEIPAAR